MNQPGPLSEFRKNMVTQVPSHVHPRNIHTGEPLAPVPDQLRTFIGSLYEPDDVVVIKPMETWVEDDKKKSRMIYPKIRHAKARYLMVGHHAWADLLHLAQQEKAHVFFGVCPRFAAATNKKSWELAWQIRTIRFLWADLDHCTVEVAVARIEKAGLPLPTATVRSGNGVHVYWRLEDPFLIDDVGEPLPVFKSFKDQGEGKKKKPEPYIVDPATPKRRSPPKVPLSLKAKHAQAVIAGIAAVIGGDHTHDLARLLRLPGTMNRKDERNGKPPVPCELGFCDPGRRYPFVAFEQYAVARPIAANRTARARKPMAGQAPAGGMTRRTRRTTFQEHVDACRSTATGSRSEVDFALTCWAIENGLEKEAVWAEVESVGKFAERGRNYFDTTWENAMKRVESNTCAESTTTGEDSGFTPPPQDGHEGGELKSERNRVDIQANGDCHAASHIVASILHHCPGLFQSNGTLFVEAMSKGYATVEAASPKSISACVTAVAQFYNLGEKGATNVQPPASVIDLLAARKNFPGVPIIDRVTNGPTLTPEGRILVTPGYDAVSRTFGAFSPLPAGLVVPTTPTRSEALASAKRLLDVVGDFPFASPADMSTWLAAMLTIVLRPGLDRVPAFLFTANRAGTGKSTLVETAVLIATGREAAPADYSDDSDKIEKLVTALLAEGKATANFDNIPNGAAFGNAVIDRLVTARDWTGRMLGHTKTLSVPNALTVFASGNNLTTKGDTTRRVIVCRLHTEDVTPGDRTDFEVKDLMEYVRTNRSALLLDLLTIAAAHAHAGGLDGGGVMGSFPEWVRRVAGTVRWLGLPCPLASTRAARVEMNATDGETAILLPALLTIKEGTFTAAQVAKHVSGLVFASAELKPSEDALLEVFSSHADKQPRQIGYKFRALKDQWVAVDGRELRLTQASKASGVTKWKVEARGVAAGAAQAAPTSGGGVIGAIGAMNQQPPPAPQTIREFVRLWYETEQNSAHT